MSQQELNLPLRRAKTPAAVATNLYMPLALKRDGAAVARDRYGWSLSHLVRALLRDEVRHKGGILRNKTLGAK